MKKSIQILVTVFAVMRLSVAVVNLVGGQKEKIRNDIAGNLNQSAANFVGSPNISGDINEAWDYIHDGNAFMKSKNYTDAIKAYRGAYVLQDYVGPLPGLKLIDAFAESGQQDEALKTLDEINIKYRFVDNAAGLKKYNEIKSRLLAAKSQVAQKTEPQLQ